MRKVLLAFVIVCLVLAVSSSVRAEDQVPITIALIPRAEPSVAPAGQLAFSSATGGTEVHRADVRQGRAAVVLPKNTRWTLRAELPGWWMPAELLLVDSAPLTMSRAVWPAAPVSGVLKMSKSSEAIPRSLAISIEEVPGIRPTDLPKGAKVNCEIAKVGKFACELPAGDADLSFRVPGFVPHYRWGVRLEPQKQYDAGVLHLKRGASLAGWAAIEGNKAKPTNATVRLVRPVPMGADARVAERLARPAAEAKVAASGFFQLAGIDPGRYELIVEQAGYASARLYPVEIHPDTETSLRALMMLKEPMTVRLAIDPATDWSGSPWHVRVSRMSDFGGSAAPIPVFEGKAKDGLIEIPNQAAGRFAATIADAYGSQYADPEFEARENAEPHRVTIGLIRITGEIRRGKKPFATRIWFGGRYGSVRVESVSDSEGKFSTILPRAGKWPVDIATPAGQTSMSVEIVANDEHESDVTLELSENRVEGIVLSAEDTPSAGVNVVLSTSDSMLTARTDSAGRFAFESVPEGEARLRARGAGGRQTNVAQVVLRGNGESVGPVELRFLPVTEIAGKVVALGTPVPGAVLTVRDGLGKHNLSVNATSDLEGKFRVAVPSDLTSAIITVSPPGHALRVFEVAIDDQIVMLNVSAEGGTLRLKFGEKSKSARLFQNGKRLELNDLMRWAMSHGSPKEISPFQDIPNVAAGSYRVCDGRGCREAQLAPGGIAEIDL